MNGREEFLELTYPVHFIAMSDFKFNLDKTSVRSNPVVQGIDVKMSVTEVALVVVVMVCAVLFNR